MTPNDNSQLISGLDQIIHLVDFNIAEHEKLIIFPPERAQETVMCQSI